MWRSGVGDGEEFPVVRRGFDRERVRAALASLEAERTRLADALAEREHELAARLEELREARRTAEEAAAQLEGALRDPDRAAQILGREAAEILRSATEAARALRRRAEAESTDLLEKSRREAARIEEEARQAAEAAVAEARQAAEAYLEQVRQQAAELTRMADRTAQGTIEAAKQEGRSLVHRASEHARKLIAEADSKVAERREELANLELARLSLRQLLEQVRTLAGEALGQVDAGQRFGRRRERSAGESTATSEDPAAARAAGDQPMGTSGTETGRGVEDVRALPDDAATALEGSAEHSAEDVVGDLGGVVARLEQPDLDLAEVTELIRRIAEEAEGPPGPESVDDAAIDTAAEDAMAKEAPGAPEGVWDDATASSETSADAEEGVSTEANEGTAAAFGSVAAGVGVDGDEARRAEDNNGALVGAPEEERVQAADAVAEGAQGDPGGTASRVSHAGGEASGAARARERLERLEVLFARLADAEGAAGLVAETGSGAPVGAEGVSITEEGGHRQRESGEEQERETGRGDAGATGASEPSESVSDLEAGTCPPSLYRRYLELAEPRRIDLARRLKRVVQDIINETLVGLRQDGPAVVTERLGALRRDPSRLAASFELHVQRNVAGGVEFAEGMLGALAGSREGVEELARGELEGLLARIDDGVLALLERALESGEDGEELAQQVGALHRELRSGRLDEMAHDAATSAFFGGVRSVGEPAGYRWLVVPTDRACPDCEDNALAELVGRGEAFPTGHEKPPAHPGCRCLVVPVIT